MDKNDQLVKGEIMVTEANFTNLSAYLTQLNNDRVIPPLEKWNPQHCGDMDLVIKANGEWWHEGQLIRRQKMIDLFSKVLWKENDEYYLKTPVEKIRIQVEDAPLLITQVDQVEIDDDLYLQCTTQNQDVFIVDAEHSIFMKEYEGEIRPYVHVRSGLNALIQRQAFYHLVNFGELDEQDQQATLSLSSGSYHFKLSIAME